ncbi:MAG: tetratricopeptide repeat protein [Isosphaeraceae bacterium]
MARIIRDRISRRLDEAEGYLMLNLPQRTLEILGRRADWATMQFEASFLAGEALRQMERYREALKPLEIAAKLRPADAHVAIALGWCYKRTHRLAQAIDALERADRHNPNEPILRYNLACYWSLAGNVPKALDALAQALDLDPDLRLLIPDESDFNQLRGNPDFERLTVGPSPLA